MKIIIPDKLRVGAHTYTVELRRDYQAIERSSASSQKATLKIILDNANHRPRSILEENYIHELLHIIFSEAGFHWSADKEFNTTEENLVERITPILYQVLIENKLQEWEEKA